LSFTFILVLRPLEVPCQPRDEDTSTELPVSPPVRVVKEFGVVIELAVPLKLIPADGRPKNPLAERSIEHALIFVDCEDLKQSFEYPCSPPAWPWALRCGILPRGLLC